jgi:hypothetical protein
VPVLELTFSDGHSEIVKVGMNGAAIVSRVGAHRALVSRSFAAPDTLVVAYNQIARINDIELQFRFTGARVAIHLLERTDRAHYEFSGRSQ